MLKLELLKKCISASGILAIFLLLPRTAQSFTNVIIATNAPVGIEQAFIQATTNQYQTDYFKNPLASNTYKLTIHGFNPSYQPPPTTLEQALSLGATVFIYGWRDGAGYQQHVSQNLVESFEVNCSTPIGFSTKTWDNNTCLAVTIAINKALYDLSLSTPPIIPPGGF